MQVSEQEGSKLELLKVLSAHTQVFPALQHLNARSSSALAVQCSFLIRTNICVHVQVVAGTNYKLLLSVADAKNAKKEIEVSVYGARPYMPDAAVPSAPGGKAGRESTHSKLIASITCTDVLRRPWCEAPHTGRDRLLLVAQSL